MKCTNKEQETAECEKRGCSGCFYNEKTADEIWKELNYIKSYNDEYKATHYKHRYFEDEFVFYDDTENIALNAESMSMQELQAINKKVQELRLERINIMEIKTKYNIGDRVWVVQEGTYYNQIKNTRELSGEVEVFDDYIKAIEINDTGVIYLLASADMIDLEEKILSYITKKISS